MKRVISNLYTRKGAKAQERVDELRSQLGLAPQGSTSTEFVEHSLATAANDFLVASGSGIIVKKTLAETKAILGLTILGPQEEVAAGESESTLSLTAFCSFISIDSNGDSFILPDATMTGQLKKIVFRADGAASDGAGTALVSGTFTGEYELLTFNNAGEYALLQWNGTYWVALELASMLDTTNAPSLSS